MRTLDWIVLAGFLLFVVVYGVWRGRRNRDLDGFLLADRDMRWWTIGLAIMATQASAITFLSTPGQAYADGMRFIQFYFGLPIAMVVLSITAVPIYHRLKVYTAYEYLEGRFDLKTRSLAAILFLIQRGLACGLTIYAPALIISLLLGWNLYIMNLVIGVLVIIYTASGGNKAVSHTHFVQMIIILGGMLTAFVIMVSLLPRDVSLIDASYVAGKMGRLNAIDFSFDINNRYNFWSGLIGGFFLALSYFGTDQSQVGRYLTGKSVAQSRLGLLLNGIVKVPMQFFILFIGAVLFAFYQFVAPPLFFNHVEAAKLKSTAQGAQYEALEKRHANLFEEKKNTVRELLSARRSGDDAGIDAATTSLLSAQERMEGVRSEAVELIESVNPRAETNDSNLVFLTFVITYLPAGLVGLVMAAVLSASMSSTSAELNALASTTIVDIYQRRFKRKASDRHYVLVSKLATVFWGIFAILFAQYATRLGSLIEAVNILGSLFYGTILGIFLVAFYVKRVGGTAVFLAALIAEAAVILCFMYTGISFLWYNVMGCLIVIFVALILQRFLAVPRPVVSSEL